MAIAVIGHVGLDAVVYWRRGSVPECECAKVDLDKLAATGVVKDSVLMGATFVAALDDLHISINPVLIDTEIELLLKNKNWALQMNVIKLKVHVRVCTIRFDFCL